MPRPHSGRPRRLLLALTVLLSVVTPATVVGAGVASNAPAAEGTVAPATEGTVAPGVGTLQGFDADRTSFRITVYENGSAEWLFRYEKSLNESERQDFEAFAQEFNTNETELFVNFRTRARWLTDNGSTATGRPMNATAFRRDARTEGLDPQTQSLGVVEMSFRWVGFARVTDAGRVQAGDVFRGGLYIGPDQELVYAPGPNLSFVTAEPETDRIISGATLAESQSVTWRGERSFSDRRPRAVFAAGDPTPDGDTTPTATGDGTDGGTGPGLLVPMGVLLVVVLLGAGAAVAYRSGTLPPSPGSADTAGGSGDAGDAGGAASASAGTDAAPVGVSEEELLSDEERVIDLLEDNGGRMKQVDIVDATDWSKSKVSMLLSDMEDDDQISKLRVGRENIVSLTGHEPDAAGSPFDDDEE